MASPQGGDTLKRIPAFLAWGVFLFILIVKTVPDEMDTYSFHWAIFGLATIQLLMWLAND